MELIKAFSPILITLVVVIAGLGWVRYWSLKADKEKKKV
jgi:hypothetical protein